MDKCRKVQGLLADYRSDLLSHSKKDWVEQHVRNCDHCMAELKALDDVLAMVADNTPELEPPAGLWNGVYNRISSPEPSRRFSGWFASMPLRVAAGSAAALAVVFALTFSGSQENSVSSVRVASTNNEYIQGHALYASQSPFADRVSYLSIAAASSQSEENH